MIVLSDDLRQVLDRWSAAELIGDVDALDTLLHPQFLFAGPFGFLLDRQQWENRFISGDLRYTAFGFTVDTPPRPIGDTTLIVGTQTQQGTHRGAPVDGRFRGTLILTHNPRPMIVGFHLSFRQPPGKSAGQSDRPGAAGHAPGEQQGVGR